MLQFEQLIKQLNQVQVEYVIIGGLAAVIHGASYVTNDLDLCYRRTSENLKKIVLALNATNPRLRTIDGPISFVFDEKTLNNGLNFTLQTDLGDLDLLGDVPGVGIYEKLISNSESVELFGDSCRVISLTDLIRAKKTAGRKKDLLILDELEALENLKKE